MRTAAVLAAGIIANAVTKFSLNETLGWVLLILLMLFWDTRNFRRW